MICLSITYTRRLLAHNSFSKFAPTVIVTQTYVNVEPNPIEAIYKFPIHEAAAICGFEAEIDGNRTIKGIVKEAQEAAKEYDEAVQVCINEIMHIVDIIDKLYIIAYLSMWNYSHCSSSIF